MKAAYDKGAKDLDPLEEGESVRLRPTSMGSKVWVKARVLQRRDQRSYVVQQGYTLLRRNGVDLRRAHHATGSPNTIPAPESPQPNATRPMDDDTQTRSRNVSPQPPPLPDVPPPPSPDNLAAPETAQPVRRSRTGRLLKGPSYLREYEC